MSLTTLPKEIHFHILTALSTPGYSRKRLKTHPFLALSLVCRGFHSLVEDFCEHFLITTYHRHYTNRNKRMPRPPRPPFVSEGRVETFRRVLIAYTTRSCRFCLTMSGRIAQPDANVVCCKKCEKIVWAELAEIKEAVQMYGVPEVVLLCCIPHGVDSSWCTRKIVAVAAVKAFAERFHGTPVERYLEARKQVRAEEAERIVAANRKARQMVLEAQGPLLSGIIKQVIGGKRPMMAVMALASQWNEWEKDDREEAENMVKKGRSLEEMDAENFAVYQRLVEWGEMGSCTWVEVQNNSF